MNTQPKFKSQKEVRRDMRQKFALKSAAKKIQAAWRVYKERLAQWEKEQEEYERSYGCDCGDWLCTGCSEGPYIACCMCGGDCRGGDYESWRFCSRRCMVRAGSD
jgi:hypothetical protein